jgi:antitoxin (DNA-binding transcriptional repressor) of toxin-antitoxin stability system
MQMKIQIEEAGDRFNEMLALAMKGTEILIMDKKKTVARLIGEKSDLAEKDGNKWTSDDFDIKLSEDH